MQAGFFFGNVSDAAPVPDGGKNADLSCLKMPLD